MRRPVFLTLAELIEIHADQIELYGGESGIRDIRLLESAASQPEASYDGEYLHESLFEMAAAYAFHIIMNHPFVDGNKRVGLVSALVFLELNGVFIEDSEGQLLGATMAIAQGKLSKAAFSKILKKLS